MIAGAAPVPHSSIAGDSGPSIFGLRHLESIRDVGLYPSKEALAWRHVVEEVGTTDNLVLTYSSQFTEKFVARSRVPLVHVAGTTVVTVKPLTKASTFLPHSTKSIRRIGHSQVEILIWQLSHILYAVDI